MGIKPTFYDFSLTDGTVVQVTRNYGALYMLRNQYPDLYQTSQSFNKKNKNDALDDIETAEFIYSAYVAATLVNNAEKKANGTPQDEIMEKEEFFMLMPDNIKVVINIIEKLYGTEKKRTNSRRRFENVQQKQKN